MLEIILIFFVILLILTFFYKQAICEFRINQIEWTQRDTIGKLLQEKIPLVVRGIPPVSFWSHEDVQVRSLYSNIPIFQETSLPQWLSSAPAYSDCPWKYSEAERIANISGLNIWANKWMNPVIINPLMKFWMKPQYHCWAGNVGLRKTFATWTCLFPVDGEITVTIMPENSESALPPNWLGCYPNALSSKDTPFISDLKFIDIILRPGNCMFMPSHWFWSWTGTDKSEKPIMTCTISYHTPISSMAFRLGSK
jgi:hypothetical protein